jgi:hypothetical protein
MKQVRDREESSTVDISSSTAKSSKAKEAIESKCFLVGKFPQLLKTFTSRVAQASFGQEVINYIASSIRNYNSKPLDITIVQAITRSSDISLPLNSNFAFVLGLARHVTILPSKSTISRFCFQSLQQFPHLNPESMRARIPD